MSTTTTSRTAPSQPSVQAETAAITTMPPTGDMRHRWTPEDKEIVDIEMEPNDEQTLYLVVRNCCLFDRPQLLLGVFLDRHKATEAAHEYRTTMRRLGDPLAVQSYKDVDLDADVVVMTRSFKIPSEWWTWTSASASLPTSSTSSKRELYFMPGQWLLLEFSCSIADSGVHGQQHLAYVSYVTRADASSLRLLAMRAETSAEARNVEKLERDMRRLGVRDHHGSSSSSSSSSFPHPTTAVEADIDVSRTSKPPPSIQFIEWTQWDCIQEGQLRYNETMTNNWDEFLANVKRCTGTE